MFLSSTQGCLGSLFYSNFTCVVLEVLQSVRLENHLDALSWFMTLSWSAKHACSRGLYLGCGHPRTVAYVVRSWNTGTGSRENGFLTPTAPLWKKNRKTSHRNSYLPTISITGWKASKPLPPVFADIFAIECNDHITYHMDWEGFWILITTLGQRV